MLSKEVDDEAAVGAPASGLAEEGHPVGRARGGERLGRAVDDEVACVRERVPEAEDGLVRLLAPAGRSAAGEHHKRSDEQEEEQAPALRRGDGGHCGGCGQAASDNAQRACAVRREREEFFACVAPCSAQLCFALYNCSRAAAVNENRGVRY
uniref:Uncharacterized protein n=1 Tax=Arundo donax TaxID=35708 RepID=A0A0A9GIH2_ARUDO